MPSILTKIFRKGKIPRNAKVEEMVWVMARESVGGNRRHGGEDDGGALGLWWVAESKKELTPEFLVQT